MERRNTVQKDLVLNAVKGMKSHPTADQVYNLISKDYPSIGKGTVYRNLNILAESGEIKKIEIPDGADRFDFNTSEHYHSQCIECKSVFDVNFDAIPDLEKHIKNTDNFKFISYDILFKGICSECQKNQTKEY